MLPSSLSRHGSINRPPTRAFHLGLSVSTIDGHGLSTSQPREPVSVLESYNAVPVADDQLKPVLGSYGASL